MCQKQLIFSGFYCWNVKCFNKFSLWKCIVREDTCTIETHLFRSTFLWERMTIIETFLFVIFYYVKCLYSRSHIIIIAVHDIRNRCRRHRFISMKRWEEIMYISSNSATVRESTCAFYAFAFKFRQNGSLILLNFLFGLWKMNNIGPYRMKKI